MLFVNVARDLFANVLVVTESLLKRLFIWKIRTNWEIRTRFLLHYKITAIEKE